MLHAPTDSDDILMTVVWMFSKSVGCVCDETVTRIKVISRDLTTKLSLDTRTTIVHPSWHIRKSEIPKVTNV